MRSNENPLQSKLILLVEADSFLASYIGEGIRASGAHILGPARTVDEAKALIEKLREPPHAAVVSADIFQEAGRVTWDPFTCMGIPLLLTVGRARALPPGSAQYSFLMTPFAAYQVVDYLRAALDPQSQPVRYKAGPTIRGH
ncbi:MAG TPA: hypothetical protein VF637_10790 [Sphingomicrobium sp.]|jgi:hypothetical protein